MEGGLARTSDAFAVLPPPDGDLLPRTLIWVGRDAFHRVPNISETLGRGGTRSYHSKGGKYELRHPHRIRPHARHFAVVKLAQFRHAFLVPDFAPQKNGKAGSPAPNTEEAG